MSRALESRRPLKDVAKKWSKLMGLASGAVALLVNFGIVTANQGGSIGELITSLDGLGAVVAGVITTAAAVWSAFGTAKEGEKQVTPVSDPRDNAMRELAPRNTQ